MEHHTDVLLQLASELYAADEYQGLLRLARTHPVDHDGLVQFDRALGGPSVSVIAGSGPGPGTLNIPGHGVGRYAVDDRDVFRPLQYCAVYLNREFADADWMARAVVEAASGHLESLVKRVGSVSFLSLGQALRIAKRKLDEGTWSQLSRFTPIYNNAKHEYSHEKDTHLFSTEDAVLAYFVSRRLGAKLYPLAHLATDLSVFEA